MQFSNHFAFVAMALAAAACQVPAAAKTEDIGFITTTPWSSANQLIFGNTFRALEFTDYYSFRVVDAPDASSRGAVQGLSLTLDPLHVQLKSVTLSDRIGRSQTWDLTNGALTFALPALDAGPYMLAISGSMTSEAIENADFIGYGAVLQTPVPEATDLAMTALGLAGVAFMARRRKIA